MNNKAVINFDKKPCINNTTPCKLTLPTRSECIVYVPTPSEGIGLLDRAELLPGVFLAASLTRGECGVCRTSIANMNEPRRTVTLLPVNSDILNESESSVTLPLSAAHTREGRLVTLRNSLRLQHLNGEERDSIVNLCEY